MKKSDKKNVIKLVKCPEYGKLYEVDPKSSICPACGKKHPKSCYIEEEVE